MGRGIRIVRCSWICLICLVASVSAQAGKIRVKTGIEVLKEQQFRPLQGKRVGLITNPTGIDNALRPTADLLYEAPGVKLVALFGPEHGVRGNMHAGDKVQDNRDELTGVPVYSLFGSSRKPTKEMLQGIDVLVYDIQHNGPGYGGCCRGGHRVYGTGQAKSAGWT